MATKLSFNAKVVLSIGAVALSALATACSSDVGPAPFDLAGGFSLQAELAARTGSRIVALTDGSSASPYGFLAADTGKPVVAPNATLDELRGFLSSLGPSLDLEARIEALPSKGELRGAGGLTVRFGQVVPGTTVPVFDSSVVLGVREDGSFAFLEKDTASGLVGYDVRPLVTLEAASALAQSRGTSEASVPAAPVLGVVRSEQGPTLAYRVEVADPAGSRRVDIDAKTGAILAEGETDLHAVAYSAASYYPSNDPRAQPGATLECGVSQGHLARETKGGRVELFDLRGMGPIAATSFGEVSVADVDTKSGASSIFAPGVAVDAQWNISQAANFFGTALATRFGRPDGRVPVYVHASLLARGAGFNPGFGAIVISDGKFGPTKPGATPPNDYPGAVAYDMMAHEYAHGMMHYSGLTSPTQPPPLPPDRTKATPKQLTDEDRFVETRAIHEGLADVFAASAKSALQPQRPVRPEVFQFGTDARPMGAPAFRNHLHPRDADPNERSQQHVSEPIANRDAMGKAYYRSGLVTHAWALMAYGSANEASNIGVQAPLGVSGAFYAFAIGSMFVRSQNPTLSDLAHATIATQLAQDARTSAACAWAAVGVLTEAEVKAKYGAVCAHFDASACALLPDGAYCNSRVPGTAYRCQNHQLAAAPNGCMTGQYCQRVSGSFASPAKLVSVNAVACGGDRDPM